MMQTGRLFSRGASSIRTFGCVLSKTEGASIGDVPAHVLLPKPIGNTGGNMPHGQNAGFLGKMYDPFVLNADPSDPAFSSSRPAPASTISPPFASIAVATGAARWSTPPSASLKHLRTRGCSIPAIRN